MSIPLTHDGAPRWMEAERCCFCFRPTRHWFAPKDVAVCKTCGEIHTPDEVPEKRIWCAEVTERLPELQGIRAIGGHLPPGVPPVLRRDGT